MIFRRNLPVSARFLHCPQAISGYLWPRSGPRSLHSLSIKASQKTTTPRPISAILVCPNNPQDGAKINREERHIWRLSEKSSVV
jgi:hypothetical protein